MIFTMILMAFLLFGVAGTLSLVFRLSWGLFKVMFGVGLFVVCPVLFLIAAVIGIFGHAWLPILLIALICIGGRRRALR